jgi:hypothetical protein
MVAQMMVRMIPSIEELRRHRTALLLGWNAASSDQFLP